MSARARWIAAIVLMLAFPVVLYGVATWMTAGDPSFRVDAGYGRSLERYETDLRQRAENERLAWTVELDPEAENGSLELRIADADGRPVTGAKVEIEAFHAGAASIAAKVLATAAGAGVYRAQWIPRRSGFHVFRCAASRGGDRFVTELRRLVAAEATHAVVPVS